MSYPHNIHNAHPQNQQWRPRPPFIPTQTSHLFHTHVPIQNQSMPPILPHPSAPHPSAPHPSAPHPSAPHPSAPRPSAPHPMFNPQFPQGHTFAQTNMFPPQTQTQAIPHLQKPQPSYLHQERSAPEKNVKNNFSNDGSFMQEFMIQQKRRAFEEKKREVSQPILNANQSVNHSTGDQAQKNADNKTETVELYDPLADESEDEEDQTKHTKHASQDAIEESEDTQIDKIESSLTPAQIDLIERTANTIAKKPSLEVSMRERCRGDKQYRFLCDKSSNEYRVFKRRLARIQETQTEPHPSVVIKTYSESESERKFTEEPKKKRKRASRWGVGENEEAFPAMNEEEELQERLRQFEDQKKLQLLQQIALEAADEWMVDLLKARLDHYGEYKEFDEKNEKRDTFEDAELKKIEDGTWEHRKRAREMMETAEKAFKLTLSGKNKHHLGDFLPPEELKKFLEEARRITSGLGPLEKEETIEMDKSNIGYKLLQKAGWKEGSGLGAQEQGRVAPVESSGGTVTTGLGVKPTNTVEEDDSEFDQYRKRMMLAYRFRPNPLNNPRRDYY